MTNTHSRRSCPLVSVIVACGDGSPGLEALAAQTGPPLEVLVVGHGVGGVAGRALGVPILALEDAREALLPALWAAGRAGGP